MPDIDQLPVMEGYYDGYFGGGAMEGGGSAPLPEDLLPVPSGERTSGGGGGGGALEQLAGLMPSWV